MPYGYSKYLRKEKGRSELTIDEHVRQLSLFFGYVKKKHNGEKELHDITSRDIKQYLELKKEYKLKPKTINKILSILKSFFDYAERIGKTIDPAVKISYLPLVDDKVQDITYEKLLEIKPSVLDRLDYKLNRKVIYLLALQGLKTQEFQIKFEQVRLIQDTAIIKIPHNDNNERIITLIGKEYEVFSEFYNQAALMNEEYILTSKKRTKNDEEDIYVPIDKLTIYINLQKIAKDFNIPAFSLNETRIAYAHYLNKKERLPVEEISSILGIAKNSAILLLKLGEERLSKTLENPKESATID